MKIALMIPDDLSFLMLRKGLIVSLINSGHEVCLIAKAGEFVPQLEALGARYLPVDFKRFINPLSDIRLLIQYYRIFRKEKFDIVHTFTVKPNTFGIIMAYLAGCKRLFNSVTGLGFMFYEPGEKSIFSKILKTGIKYLFKLACCLTEKTWFQNPDDVKYFIDNDLIRPEQAVLIKSSGINLAEWKLPDNEKVSTLKKDAGFQPDDILILMVARSLNSKGIHEYIFAMEQLAGKFPNAKFLLAGEAEDNMNRGVSATFLREKEKSLPFYWLGQQKNVMETYAIADIFVLPSYYREGVPRVLLEAMALKKPIVTTDSVGCREPVEDGVNGFLVPVRDGQAVYEKLEILIKNSELRRKMGNAGFEKAKLEFAEHLIVDALLKNIYQFSK